jgi:hypothetical protein
MDDTHNKYRINAYKIWYTDNPNEIYVGSTKESLAKRMTGHRCASRRGKTTRICQIMREKGETNFEYVLLGSHDVYNKDEQRMYEQTWIDQLKPSLNSISAYLTPQKKLDYINSTERKEKKLERSRLPINIEKRKEYSNKPEIKKKIFENRSTPEMKKVTKDYFKEYYKINSKKTQYCKSCMRSVLHSNILKHQKTQKHKRMKETTISSESD